MTTNQPKFPDESRSYWREDIDFPTFPPLNENTEVDIAIIGAGLTGVTAAYLLAKEGKKIALVEADNILNGTTGHTTAKISAQHGVIYNELIQNAGKNNARLYYEANSDALAFITNTISELQIDCDFSKQD